MPGMGGGNACGNPDPRQASRSTARKAQRLLNVTRRNSSSPSSPCTPESRSPSTGYSTYSTGTAGRPAEGTLSDYAGKIRRALEDAGRSAALLVFGMFVFGSTAVMMALIETEGSINIKYRRSYLVEWVTYVGVFSYMVVGAIHPVPE